LSLTLTVSAGTHNLTLLSESTGIDNGMSSGSVGKVKGIVGSITLGGHNLTGST
jgi:hypothetical protein